MDALPLVLFSFSVALLAFALEALYRRYKLEKAVRYYRSRLDCFNSMLGR